MRSASMQQGITLMKMRLWKNEALVARNLSRMLDLGDELTDTVFVENSSSEEAESNHPVEFDWAL